MIHSGATVAGWGTNPWWGVMLILVQRRGEMVAWRYLNVFKQNAGSGVLASIFLVWGGGGVPNLCDMGSNHPSS